jgi:hypothetical protein
MKAKKERKSKKRKGKQKTGRGSHFQNQKNGKNKSFPKSKGYFLEYKQRPAMISSTMPSFRLSMSAPVFEIPMATPLTMRFGIVTVTSLPMVSEKATMSSLISLNGSVLKWM